MIFSGFDSAWGARNSGAICHLVLGEDGSLQLDSDPVIANWDYAIAQAAQTEADLHVWAIDQPICVRNPTGCRPVEQDLARALMAAFGCGAHSSNLGNPCWQPGARIWEFIHALEENHYGHNPMAIPAARRGRYYFECYPHPALLGIFNLEKILKYKVHQKNQADWISIIGLLRSLTNKELPIRNIGDFVREDLAQTKPNEDRVDAIISAYTAAYWWKFGIERSTMIGDLATGYIVTPHSNSTYAAFAKVFQGRMNLPGRVDGPLHTPTSSQPAVLTATTRATAARTTGTDRLPVEPARDWSGPVELLATDTSNIWRNSNSWMHAARMEGWRLWIRFVDEDGQPAVLFVPFDKYGSQQGGMKASPRQMNRGQWSFMVADAARTNPIRFHVFYRYEQIE
jgi:predicted RNase H-like nuclease